MKIRLIVIKTHKPKELAALYALFGIHFEYHQHENGPHHYAVEGHGTVFEIYPLPKGMTLPDNSIRLGFEVRDLKQVIVALKRKAVKIIAEPAQNAWGYTAVVEDLDGRKIELTQETA